MKMQKAQKSRKINLQKILLYGISCMGLIYLFMWTKHSQVIMIDKQDATYSVSDYFKSENYNTPDIMISLDTVLDSVSCHKNEPNFTASSFMSEEAIIERTKDCDKYFRIIETYAFEPVTTEESEFPLAFTSTIHKQIGIWELFMATYFRPTDSHCVHIDKKSSETVYSAVQGIVNCYNLKFPETTFFITNNNIPVFWGYGSSIQEADMICFRELMKANKSWKVLANMAGTELPFVSHQMFRARVKKAGGNLLEIEPNHFTHRQRAFYQTVRNGPEQFDMKIRQIKSFHPPPPPCKLYVYKGLKNGAFTRPFVEFVTENKYSIEFYNWIWFTGHVCEHFLNTLASLAVTNTSKGLLITQRYDAGVLEQRDHWDDPNYGIVGQDACYRQYLYKDRKTCSLVKEQCNFDLKSGEKKGIFGEKNLWTNKICYRSTNWYTSCHGKSIRGICNYSVRDLPRAKKRGCLIGNKFDMGVSTQAILCQIKEIKQFTRNYTTDVTQNFVSLL